MSLPAKSTVKTVPFIEYEPVIYVNEKDFPTLADKREGQKLRVIINYKVIEKTKSFSVLKIQAMQVFQTKRKF